MIRTAKTRGIKVLGMLVLPLLAALAIGSWVAPADAARTASNAISCGPAVASITDPVLRQSFEQLDRTQSVAAAKVCAIYTNSLDAVR